MDFIVPLFIFIFGASILVFIGSFIALLVSKEKEKPLIIMLISAFILVIGFSTCGSMI